MVKLFTTIMLICTILFSVGCSTQPAKVKHEKPNFISVDKSVIEDLGTGRQVLLDKNNIFEVEYNEEKYYLYVVSITQVTYPSSANLTSIMLINPITKEKAMVYSRDVRRLDSVYTYMDLINDMDLKHLTWVTSTEADKAANYVLSHNKLAKQGGKIESKRNKK